MSRKAGMSFSFILNADHPAPLHEQLYESIRQAIVHGQLTPQEKLPSTRALAKHLNIARNTVVTAYNMLACEGYITTQPGAASIVSLRFNEKAPIPNPKTSRPDIHIPSISSRATNHPKNVWPIIQSPSTLRTFPVGQPALDLFPANTWEKILKRRWSLSSYSLLSYKEQFGYLPLREAIAHYVTNTRGLKTTSDQVIIVAGAQQAFQILTQLLIDPGDGVLLEDPGYPGSLAAVLAAGGQVMPMTIDQEGAQLDTIDNIHKARLAIVTPTHQFPMGVTLSKRRRTQLINWAIRNNGWIIEDDYDSEFYYHGRPSAALAASCPQRAIYVGTFSKILSPSLRLGYVVLPSILIEAFIHFKSISTNRTPTLEQAVVCDFITSGAFLRHIRKMRTIYEERHGAFHKYCAEILPEDITIHQTQAGMQSVLFLNRQIDEIQQQAMSYDLSLLSLSRFSIKTTTPGLVLGFSAAKPQNQKKALINLSKLLRSLK